MLLTFINYVQRFISGGSWESVGRSVTQVTRKPKILSRRAPGRKCGISASLRRLRRAFRTFPGKDGGIRGVGRGSKLRKRRGRRDEGFERKVNILFILTHGLKYCAPVYLSYGLKQILALLHIRSQENSPSH